MSQAEPTLQAEHLVVVDKNGARGIIDPASQNPDHNGSQITVSWGDNQSVLVPTNLLVERRDGSYFLPLSLAELESQLTARTPEVPRQNSINHLQGSEVVVVPVIVEEIQIEKRKVDTGRVRITKHVREREEVVDEPLLQEQVDVQHVAINRLVDAPPPIRYVGDVMIVPLLEEVLVLEKRLMLKEELHISRRQTEVHNPQRVILRSEEVTVERIDEADQLKSNTDNLG
ncbi:MAG: YsnF/AvaK domain-containing protein [Pyrinomonadaceae bacterium]|nr:YsnF/AvaK domain-containing protein [Pyrinomonadaceae bacterium]